MGSENKEKRSTIIVVVVTVMEMARVRDQTLEVIEERDSRWVEK
jgi:hypothetical protein